MCIYQSTNICIDLVKDYYQVLNDVGYSRRPPLEISFLGDMGLKKYVKKSVWKKLVEYDYHLHILVLNKIWVEWISGMWDPNTTYSKNESKLLFTDGLK